MGHVVIAYAIVMTEFFILLAIVMSMQTALWMFGIVLAVCTLGIWACVWWEEGTYKIAREDSYRWRHVRGSVMRKRSV